MSGATKLPPARPLPARPDSAGRPASDPGRERRGSQGGEGFLPTIGGAVTPEREAGGGPARRPPSGGMRSVLRECNWVVSSPVPKERKRPGSAGKRESASVGAYLQALARDDGEAFLREMNVVGEEVRALQRANSEGDGHKRSMRARMLQLEEELTTVMAARVEDMESAGATKQFERDLELCQKQLAASQKQVIHLRKRADMTASAEEADAKVLQLQAELEAQESSWKEMFESSMANMETVAAKVGGLEGQLQTAAADVERTSSERRLTQVENEALKADVKRAGEVADENQAKIAQLYADLVAEQKGHAETQVTAEAAKLAASEAASDAAEKLAEERRQISLLKSEAVLQAEHLAEQLASLQAAELAAQVLKGELAAAAAAQAEAEAGMSEKAEECAGQAEQLAESAGRHGGLAAQLEELTAKIAASEAAEGQALAAARERVNLLYKEVGVMQTQMAEANAKSATNLENHQAVTIKSKELALALRESNDRVADLKHEVGYLLSQLAQAKATVASTAAEQPPPHGERFPEGPSKPVWEQASVVLPTDDPRVPGADSIVRMRVIEWGTVGCDAGCQTDGEFMDAREINAATEQNKRSTLFKAWGAAELEQQLRETGAYSEADLLGIVAFPFEDQGEHRWMTEQARAEERKMRAAGTYTEAQIMQAVADRDPDIQRALLAHMRLTAATKLQSGCRGKIARNRVKEERVRIAALPPPEVQVEAAVRIQAVGRGHVTRQQLEDGKTTEMACQTDEVIIFEPTEDLQAEVPLYDPETLRAKRHLEKRLRETGGHSEVDIIRLLYGPETIDAEHDVLLNGGVIDDSLMQIIEPELLEAAPMQPGMAGLQELLSRAGLLEVAIAEYLDLWSEMGIDDGMLDVWHSGVITSAALEADFGIASLGDRYKILGALQALPSGGVVPGAADGNGRTGGPGFGAAGSWPAIGATAAGGSSGEVALPHPALSSTARFTDQQGPSPSELVDPVLANARRLLASEPDLPIPAAGAEALSSTAPEAVDRSAERAPTPTLEDLGAVRGEFEAKKVEMAAMLSTHFEDAIMERNRLLQEAEVAAGRMADLQGKFDFVQSSLAFAQEQLMHERQNNSQLTGEVEDLSAARDGLQVALNREKLEADNEAARVAQQLRVATEKLTAERLEKEQYKVLVDKIGAEIVKEKEDDKHLVEEYNRDRALWREQNAALEAKAAELAAEIERLRKDMAALQDSLDMKESFAKRVEAEKENMVVSLRDVSKQLADSKKQVDELLQEKENVTGELREHTEQYRDRLLEQLEQIKELRATIEKRDAELAAAKADHLSSDEHAQQMIEKTMAENGDLREQLEKLGREKEKVAKNCFEQMTKLNNTLQEMAEIRAEQEANRQRDTAQVAQIDDLEHQLGETARERDDVSAQMEDFRSQVEQERQAYSEAVAEKSVYSDQVKRLELAVFESDMARKDAVSKTKAKMRALSSEKDNISSAYLKTTLRLAQSKESEQEAQERMVQALADRDGLQHEVDRLNSDMAATEGERDKYLRKLKQSNKARVKAEEDMRGANRRAIEVEEVLAEKVRQLGERIFNFEG